MIENILALVLVASLDENQIDNQGLMHSKSSSRYEIEVKSQTQEALLKPFGLLRTAYIYRDEHSISHDTQYSTAIGGQFGVDTRTYQGFNLHVAGYTSVKIEALSGKGSQENREFLNEEGKSYIYLGEASLEYETEGFEAMIGRIRIDTPYADSDDYRMSPNTFEGFWGYKELTTELSFEFYYLSRMAGIDSAGSQDAFEDLYISDGFGLAGASLEYHFDEDNDISLWYYYVDKMSHILYSELNYAVDFSKDLHFNAALQASSIMEIDDSNIDGNVLGGAAVLHYKNLFFGAAYNYGFVDDRKEITDGFGGGAYYTSLDEATIGAVSTFAVGEDVEAYRVGIGYENVFLDKLVVELIHGHLRSKERTVDVKENNIILSYQMTEAFYFELVGAKYKEQKSNNTFKRLVMRLDYSF